MEQPNQNQNSADDSDDKLRAENAFMKLKLELDYGMEQSEFSEVDPVVENQFLTQILEFEKNYKNAKLVTVFEYLGQPVFRKADELLPDDFGPELTKLKDMMAGKNVVIDSIHTYPDELMYRFITEELFFAETDDFTVEGMTKGFIYEEFHPSPDEEDQ